MKRIIFSCLFTLALTWLNAQWTTVGSNGLTTTKKVGIGMNPSQIFGQNGYLFVLNKTSIVGSEFPQLNISTGISDGVTTSYPAIGVMLHQTSGGILGSPISINGDGIIYGSQRLHFRGGSGISLNYFIDNSQYGFTEASGLFVEPVTGDIGIHNTSPTARLHIKHTGVRYIEGDAGLVHGVLIENDGVRGHDYALEIRSGHGKIFDISNSGHMHLGPNLNFDIPNSDEYRLYVEDGIRTEQLKVDIAADNGWADYVFEEDYPLKSLDEVESYINANKHLPDVPSAEQMVKNGLNVAEMDALLLRKIEELTLYVIDLKKQNNVLQQQLNNLKTTTNED